MIRGNLTTMPLERLKNLLALLCLLITHINTAIVSGPDIENFSTNNKFYTMQWSFCVYKHLSSNVSFVLWCYLDFLSIIKPDKSSKKILSLSFDLSQNLAQSVLKLLTSVKTLTAFFVFFENACPECGYRLQFVVLTKLGLYMDPNNLCCVTRHFLLLFLCPCHLLRIWLRHVTFYICYTCIYICNYSL